MFGNRWNMGTDITIMLILIVFAILIYLYELDELKFEFRQTLLTKQLKLQLEQKHIASIILYKKSSNQKYLIDKTENIKAFLVMFDKIKIRKEVFKGGDEHNLSDMNFKFLILSHSEEVFPIMYNTKTKDLMLGENFFQLKNDFEKDINEWIIATYSPVGY